ncbi:recombinase RecT [Occultella kanbiaonis]|uniref:recombinase RecT n=1 Tax=Occultella kanbiaonis TaxID=2675754 RepID=UPI0013D28870|nr:recombinase RecT [Occultella kanbiaonis]
MGQIGQAVATQQDRAAKQPQTIAGFIQSMQGEIARALPKHMDADRMARLALTVVRKTPKLADCTPESFAGALLTAAALGLEPGVNDECYLVPYGKECQFIIGYKGMTKLFYQHPMASYIDAQAVFENDDFDYAYGTDPYLRHKPSRGDRGDLVEYYAVAKLSNGASAFVVLSPAEVKALRGGAVGPSGKIKDPQRWMERKTALRQLVKLLPKSTTLASAVESDGKVGSALNRELPPAEPQAPQIAPTVETEQGTVDASTGEILDPDDYAAPPDEFYDQGGAA